MDWVVSFENWFLQIMISSGQEKEKGKLGNNAFFTLHVPALHPPPFLFQLPHPFPYLDKLRTGYTYLRRTFQKLFKYWRLRRRWRLLDGEFGDCPGNDEGDSDNKGDNSSDDDRSDSWMAMATTMAMAMTTERVLSPFLSSSPLPSSSPSSVQLPIASPSPSPSLLHLPLP